jgi:hypothetical protein
MRTRADALAERLEQGARALETFARTLTDVEWNSRIPGDGRKVGVVVHHVASMYPIEIEAAQTIAAGHPLTVTWADIHAINAAHALRHDRCTVDEALDLLRRNSADAAVAIREMDDAALDGAAPVALNADAPLTCQFFLEDHAVRHSFYHLARIRSAVARLSAA